MLEAIDNPYKTLDQHLRQYNIDISDDDPVWIEKFSEPHFDECTIAAHAGIKYLHVEEQYYLEDHQITRFKKTIKQPITMSGVEECSKVLIDFNPRNKLYINKIFVYREGQRLDKRNSAEIQVLRRESQAERNVLSGDLTVSIILHDIKVNDIIMVSFSLTYFHEFQVKFFNEIINLEYAVSIHRLFLAVCYDKEKLAYRLLDEKKCEIQWKEDQEKQILIIQKMDLPAREIKKYEPYWYWKFSYLQVCINKSWQDVAVSYLQYFQCPAINDAQLLKLIDELKQNPVENEKIVLKIFNFIQSNIRYFSNYDPLDFIKPTDPNTTMKRAYGDCKDLVFLFRTVLNCLDIPSFPVLVNSVQGKNLNSLLPSAFIFDHAIILIKIDEKEYFIDPTIRQDINSLEHIFLPKLGYGLVCAEKTEGLRSIENSTECKDTLVISEQYQVLSLEGNDILFRLDMTLTGLLALRIMRNCSDDQSKENFFESFAASYQKIMVINEVVKNKIFFLKNNQANIILEYRISLRYVVKKKNKIHALEITPVDILENVFFSFPPEIEEGTAFYYGALIDIDYDLEILNAKIKEENVPKVVVENEFFLFSKENLCKTGRNRIKYKFKKIKEVIFPGEYVSFLGHLETMKKVLPTLIFDMKKQSQRFLDISPSWPYVLGALLIGVSASFVKNFSNTDYSTIYKKYENLYSAVKTPSCETLACRVIGKNSEADKKNDKEEQGIHQFAELSSPYKIKADLNYWKLSDTTVSGVGYSQLYEPFLQGSVMEERVDIIYGKGEKSALNQFFQAVANGDNRFCESNSRELLSKTSNTLTYYSRLNQCRTPSFHGQIIRIEKAFAQPDGLYLIQYTSVSYDVNPDEIARMKQVILSSTLIKNPIFFKG